MITPSDTDFLKGTKVYYLWRFKPWEEPSWEQVTIIGRTMKRVTIIHDDKKKNVAPENLYEEKPR